MIANGRETASGEGESETARVAAAAVIFFFPRNGGGDDGQRCERRKTKVRVRTNACVYVCVRARDFVWRVCVRARAGAIVCVCLGAGDGGGGVPVCLPADDRRPRVEGVYHVTIELLRRPVLLLTSSGGDGDDVGGGSGGGVVVDRRTRVEPTTKSRGGARAPVYRFLYNILSRVRLPASPTFRHSVFST